MNRTSRLNKLPFTIWVLPMCVGITLAVFAWFGFSSLTARAAEMRRSNCGVVATILACELAHEIGPYDDAAESEMPILVTISNVLVTASYPSQASDDLLVVLEKVEDLLQTVANMENPTKEQAKPVYNEAARICLEYAKAQWAMLETPLEVYPARGDVPDAVNSAIETSVAELRKTVSNLKTSLEKPGEDVASLTNLVYLVERCCMATRRAFLYYCLGAIEYRNAVSREQFIEMEGLLADVTDQFNQAVSLIVESDHESELQAGLERVDGSLKSVVRRQDCLKHLRERNDAKLHAHLDQELDRWIEALGHTEELVVADASKDDVAGAR
jgi:hypothetical protein